MSETFYWHDYETFGADPSRDRPVQFAGLRTDSELNPIGDPLVVFCRPSDDVLPQPEACLVTGITPQQALEQGVPECEFIGLIHEQLARPGTCGVGYNSLRFDDEVTRFTLYRNFYDPYAREWRNGNSRWDILDMVRTAFALRPDGIQWPRRDDGLPSFRLQDLTAANGIGHEAAHDALADVEATIAMARLVREKQPRLFDYVLRHRDKASARALLDVETMKPVLHVSGMFGAQRHNIALIAPLAAHPRNQNEVICYDLSVDPGPVIEASGDELRQALFARADEQPADFQRPGLKTVHLNRCPVLVTARMVDPATAGRLGISGDECRRHLAALRAYRAAAPDAFTEKIQAVFGERDLQPITDPDRMLYSGGFFSRADREKMDHIPGASAADLAALDPDFDDARLPEMLFRYRARNFPDSLTREERQRWGDYRYARLTDPEAGASICLDDYQLRIEELLAGDPVTARDRAVLTSLLEYGDQLLAE